MSTSCLTAATGTTINVTTVESIFTTFTGSLSTEAPTVTTITTQGCVADPLNLTCIPTPTTLTSTIAGSVDTIQVPVTGTTQVLETHTITLFGSSCTTFIASSSAAPVKPPPPPPPSSGSLSLSLSTPPASVFVSHSATVLSNGETSSVEETITSTFPPSYVTVTLPPSGTHGLQESPNNNTSTNVGAIVGGALGGFFGLLGLALIAWFILKRRRRWDDIFDRGIDADVDSPRSKAKRFSLDAEVEPKPYQYGLVGHTRSPSINISPPPTPQPFSHPTPERQNSLAPLLLPNSVSTPGHSASVSSRPSTAGSMRPLRDGHSHNRSTSGDSHVSPAMPSHWGHHSPSPSAGQEYFDQGPGRAGSPAASVMEYEPQLRLRLANRGDEEMDESPPVGSPLANGAGKARHIRLGSGGTGVLVHTDAGPVPPEFHG
ncbi:hypothetical protein FB45DRAFT_914367 [Roridomyces roridus]|uniref:Mid2 domain-containing protein n=1 Tax=Roridomyces roridus TaxID=1738132 RepID=A0AAD7BXM3_9AGAR|nr:hypothetical protein FB45DRAFT_914367 [Roridomyces roridus]